MTTAASPFTDSDLRAYEASVIAAVSEAGEYVMSRFAGDMTVDSKSDTPGMDLVTDVDKRSQAIIESVMRARHPDHQLLGEEDQQDGGVAAEDVVWSVDPIDGTHNYVNRSPTFAVSAGILHRGRPIAGAVWYPWALASGGSTVVRARLGGGAYRGDERLSVMAPKSDSGRPSAGRLAALPINARQVLNFDPDLRGHVGDIRVTGCAAQEMLHVATGMYQYSIVGVAAVWDFAATAVIVSEAGGKLLATYGGADGAPAWSAFVGWGAYDGAGAGGYANDVATYERMRKWRGLMVAAHPQTVDYLRRHVTLRRPGVLRQLAMRLRGPRPGRGHGRGRGGGAGRSG